MSYDISPSLSVLTSLSMTISGSIHVGTNEVSQFLKEKKPCTKKQHSANSLGKLKCSVQNLASAKFPSVCRQAGWQAASNPTQGHREGLKVRVEDEHSEKFFKKPVSALNTKVTVEKIETTDVPQFYQKRCVPLQA